MKKDVDRNITGVLSILFGGIIGGVLILLDNEHRNVASNPKVSKEKYLKISNENEKLKKEIELLNEKLKNKDSKN